MKTGLITSNTYQKHDTGQGHPEQIARVSVIVDNFKKLSNKNLLWKISKDGILNSYLYGTMHLRNKRVFEFGDSFMPKFNQIEFFLTLQ